MLSTSASDFRKEMKKYLDLVIEDFQTLIIYKVHCDEIRIHSCRLH